MQTFRERFFDFMSNINPLVIVFLMCVGFSILTYIIPGGQFERHSVMVMGHARDIVVPGSFHRTQSYPQGFFQLWTIFMRGAVEGAERSFVIMLSAGALTAIIATGAISAGIQAVIGKAGRLGIIFIPAIVFAIGLCGSTFGMYEEAIPFILILAPLMLAMGFDSMVAVFILYWGVAIGFACGITNPYNVAIGQGDLLLTPLQLLDYISAIANGGTLYRPFVNAASAPEARGDLTAYAPEIKQVQEAMRAAVTQPRGTAYTMHGMPLPVCAKTGSAQIHNNQEENALFVGYAPCANPQIAVLVLIENSVQGSLNAVPIAKDVMNWWYFNRGGGQG